jgi:hypothetical protein
MQATRFLAAGRYDYRDDHEAGDYEANASTDPESIEHREQEYPGIAQLPTTRLR